MSDRFRFRPDFKKALHDAKVMDIKKQYTKRKGYIVKDHYEIEDGVYIDLYVETPKGKKVTIFEVIVHPISKKDQKTVDTLLDISTRLGYEFRTVSVILPVTPDIEIGWLNNALFDYFVENQQDFLNTLSTSARYEKVESDTQSITISHSEKSVYVYGEVSISTPGAHQGDGAKSFHGFPYEGKFFLNIRDLVVSVISLRGFPETGYLCFGKSAPLHSSRRELN
jgi:hypothetical protein